MAADYSFAVREHFVADLDDGIVVAADPANDFVVAVADLVDGLVAAAVAVPAHLVEAVAFAVAAPEEYFVCPAHQAVAAVGWFVVAATVPDFADEIAVPDPVEVAAGEVVVAAAVAAEAAAVAEVDFAAAAVAAAAGEVVVAAAVAAEASVVAEIVVAAAVVAAVVSADHLAAPDEFCVGAFQAYSEADEIVVAADFVVHEIDVVLEFVSPDRVPSPAEFCVVGAFQEY